VRLYELLLWCHRQPLLIGEYLQVKFMNDMQYTRKLGVDKMQWMYVRSSRIISD
jgi:hypothetical protein